MSKENELKMEFEQKKIKFMEFLSNEKEKIEKMKREGGFYDFKYGQYIIDEIHNITIMYMEVYKK